MFNNANKTLLLKGCEGFIGSKFVPYFLEKCPEYNLVNLDLLTYAVDLENLKECEGSPRYQFIKDDVCNSEPVEFLFNDYEIQGVIQFAAESHVDNSIKKPGVFVQTNVNGNLTLLDVAYKNWMDAPFNYKTRYRETATASTKLRRDKESHREQNAAISDNVIESEAKQSVYSCKDLITFVEDRAGHDCRYAIDATKLETQLGWKADENFDSGIVKTVEWCLEKYNR